MRRRLLAGALLGVFAAQAWAAPLGFFDPANQTAVLNTRARFAVASATAGFTDGTGTPAALLASMTIVSGATTDRNGTFAATSSPSLYTWFAVTHAAGGAGMFFYDGTGYGGFNGAQSTGLYTGPDTSSASSPTTIHQSYTDGNGTIWDLYRGSGHSTTTPETAS